MSGVRDFTLDKYRALVRALAESGYPSLSIAGYMSGAPRPPSFVLLRHDVEGGEPHALRLAAIERDHGMSATYFLRARGGFPARVIEELRRLGHEIGYHYETMARARGDAALALDLFARDLQRLRRTGPVLAASMHGSPLLPWDNRDMWVRARPADFGLAGEVYADIDYADVRYFSDTGRTWHPTRHNLRDHVGAAPDVVCDGTDDLMAVVRSRRFPRLCLLAHPDRWSGSTAAWAARAVRDGVENGLKGVLGRIYAPRLRRSGS